MPKRRGRPADTLRLSLFLLEHHDDRRINKNMCSEEAIDTLRKDGYGPPADEFLEPPKGKEKGRVHFPFAMTTEEFKNKLVEIYSKLDNKTYLLMRADKSNILQNLNIASCSYNPKEIHNSNLGHGKLYIRFATEEQIHQVMLQIPAVTSTTPPPKRRKIHCKILPKPTANSTSQNIMNSDIPFPTNDSVTNGIQCLSQEDKLQVLSNLTERLLSVGLFDSITSHLHLLSSTNVSDTPMSFGPHEETSQNDPEKCIEDKVYAEVCKTKTVNVLPELSKMDSLFSRIQSGGRFIRHAKLHVGGTLAEFLGKLDGRRFKHVTCLNSNKNWLNSEGATALVKVLPSLELLEELDLDDTGIDEDDVEKVLLALKSCTLKILNLAYNKVGAKGATALAEVLPSLELLEKLYLDDVGLDEVDVEKVLLALKSCKKLKILRLGKNIVGGKGATSLVKVLTSLELLEGLELHECGLDEVDVEKVLLALKSCKKLKILSLSKNNVGAKGATALVKVLPSLELLEVLYLHAAVHDEVDLEKVLLALKSCKKLKILSLGKNKVGGKGATALVEVLPSLELLEVLFLHDAGLDEVDVEKVLLALKSCKKLKILRLNNNKVGAKGATALAEVLPSLELLEQLYLDAAVLDEVDVEKVLLALKSCTLKILNLAYNKVGAKGVTALVEVLPSLELLEELFLSNTGLSVESKTTLRAAISSSEIKLRL